MITIQTSLFSVATALIFILQCSASRLLMKPQQYGGGFDPIAATQPTLPFPGGPVQIPSMPNSGPQNFPSFQQHITNNPPHYNLPSPSPPPPPPPSTNTNSGASAAVIGGGVSSNIPAVGLPAYPSMPSYIPKFPPFPFIPTMPSLPSLPVFNSGGSSSSSSSSAAQSSLSSSPSACNDKPHANNNNNALEKQP